MRNLALLGTNFGGERTPGWVHNLVAHPEAVAEWRDNTAHVRAVQLDPDADPPSSQRRGARFLRAAATRYAYGIDLSVDNDTSDA